MLDVHQFRTLIVNPILRSVGLWSEAAENLVLGTALIESNLTYVKQVGGGPALGLYQMEPATAQDICWRYVPSNGTLAFNLASRTWPQATFIDYHDLPKTTINKLLVTDLAFSTIMCRLKYHSIKEALPPAEDIDALAAYWKKYYNTPLGKGKAEHFVNRYKIA